MDRDKAERRREIEQRLAFIACRPFRERRVDHINVMARSGVPVDQESSDLHRCIALVPGNVVGEQSARAHVRGPDLDGRSCPPDAARPLAHLRLVADDVLEREDCWIPDLPPCASAPTLVRGVNPAMLPPVVGTIRRPEAVEVKHPPLSSPEPRWRWIAPHVIRLNCGMQGGKAKIAARKALLYHALRGLGLNTDPAAQRSQDKQIVLLNRKFINADHR